MSVSSHRPSERVILAENDCKTPRMSSRDLHINMSMDAHLPDAMDATDAVVTVTVLEGKELKNKKMMGMQDVSIKLEGALQTFQTEIAVDSGVEPKYTNQVFRFPMRGNTRTSAAVTVTAMKEDGAMREELGHASINLYDYRHGNNKDFWLPLVDDDEPAGSLHLTIQSEGDVEAAPPAVAAENTNPVIENVAVDAPVSEPVAAAENVEIPAALQATEAPIASTEQVAVVESNQSIEQNADSTTAVVVPAVESVAVADAQVANVPQGEYSSTADYASLALPVPLPFVIEPTAPSTVTVSTTSNAVKTPIVMPSNATVINNSVTNTVTAEVSSPANSKKERKSKSKSSESESSDSDAEKKKKKHRKHKSKSSSSSKSKALEQLLAEQEEQIRALQMQLQVAQIARLQRQIASESTKKSSKKSKSKKRYSSTSATSESSSASASESESSEDERRKRRNRKSKTEISEEPKSMASIASDLTAVMSRLHDVFPNAKKDKSVGSLRGVETTLRSTKPVEPSFVSTVSTHDDSESSDVEDFALPPEFNDDELEQSKKVSKKPQSQPKLSSTQPVQAQPEQQPKHRNRATGLAASAPQLAVQLRNAAAALEQSAQYALNQPTPDVSSARSEPAAPQGPAAWDELYASTQSYEPRPYDPSMMYVSTAQQQVQRHKHQQQQQQQQHQQLQQHQPQVQQHAQPNFYATQPLPQQYQQPAYRQQPQQQMPRSQNPLSRSMDQRLLTKAAAILLSDDELMQQRQMQLRQQQQQRMAQQTAQQAQYQTHEQQAYPQRQQFANSMNHVQPSQNMEQHREVLSRPPNHFEAYAQQQQPTQERTQPRSINEITPQDRYYAESSQNQTASAPQQQPVRSRLDARPPTDAPSFINIPSGQPVRPRPPISAFSKF